MIHPIKKESNILLVNSLPKAQQDIQIPITPTCAIRVHIPQVIKESYNYVANYYLEIIDNIIERVKRNLDDDFGIKPGNLMILRENNASHIGIVTKVNKDGSFETIEGNVRYNGIDSVVKQNYNANYSDLSGFVRLSV